MSQQQQMFQKRDVYQSLCNNLTQLSRKLTHPGLIPMAPRLYLAGELIRTNEILVLLGRSGEASYFAERTAWQAHQIVRRRLGSLEQGLQELLATDTQVNIQNRTSPKRKKRVTFREPVVCASPPLRATRRPNSSAGTQAHAKQTVPPSDKIHFEGRKSDGLTGKAYSDLEDNLSTRLEHSNTPKVSDTLRLLKPNLSQSQNHAEDSVSSIPKEYMDVLRAAELDEDSSEEDTEGDYVNSVVDDYSQFMSRSTDAPEIAKPSSLQQEGTDKMFSSLYVQNQREEIKPGDETSDNKQALAPEQNKASERKLCRAEFQEALRNAQRQVKEDGIVNLVEFYDNESENPTSVDLPLDFRPDDNVDFENDSDEFLDMTSKAATATTKQPSVTDNLVNFLREEARKEEDQERMETAKKQFSDYERRKNNLEKEKKEFGTGLAKGFFGATALKRKSDSEEQITNMLPASHTEIPEVSELRETGAVQERIVERKTSRKSSRRHRKPPATITPEIMPLTVSQQNPEVTEDNVDSVAPHMSRFRQLRQLDKVAPDMVTNR